MIRVQEISRTLPFYRAIPLTVLPLVYQREHLFPYTSYGDTERESVARRFRMVQLENDWLRIEVAPELGGRVWSFFDKRIGKELLFSNPVVKPVRVLPIWGFISGGIEFNFPIAHSPTSIAEVGCTSGRVGQYGFIRVGETEARTGMEWVVELGLMEGSSALAQRTAVRNGSGADHPWMWWTIAAMRSTEGTEFIHSPGWVLLHHDRVVEVEWPGESLNWERSYKRMTALFWKKSCSPDFGVFHHDLGFGLMHWADPAQVPGKKIWTYGHGQDRCWGEATSAGGLSYLEMESGPLLDQSEKPLLLNGAELRFEEYWIPVHSRGACGEMACARAELPAMEEPWLGSRHSAWQTEWERFGRGEGPLPKSEVVTGMALENALRRELERGNPDAGQKLALWLAFHGRAREALEVAEQSKTRGDQRVAGLILWKALHQPEGAVPYLEAGPLEDPVAVIELDALYSELGLVDKRKKLLAGAVKHRLIMERRADLAVATGDPKEAIRILKGIEWPREHQRYVRTELWRRAKAALGEDDGEAPERLHEDNLARFGAYWSE